MISTMIDIATKRVVSAQMPHLLLGVGGMRLFLMITLATTFFLALLGTDTKSEQKKPIHKNST